MPLQQPKSKLLELTPGALLQPREAKEPKALTAAIPSSKSAIQLTEDSVSPKPARIPTIIITQGSGKPVAGAMDSPGYASHNNKSHKKWIWLGILAAGGVVGALPDRAWPPRPSTTPPARRP